MRDPLCRHDNSLSNDAGMANDGFHGLGCSHAGARHLGPQPRGAGEDWCTSERAQSNSQVVQPDETTLLLDLRGVQRRAWLRISWHPVRASISTCASPLDVSRAAIFSFGTQLHTHLRGLVLSAARLPEPWERVARLDFAHRLDGDVVRSMHIEIMGRTSNVVVTNEEGRVLLCAYQVRRV